jgi:hypothetical protein
MKNTVTATIPFSFKGKNFTPSAEIDLDKLCHLDHGLEALAHIIARKNSIGAYSYEYEILLSSPINFSTATGAAKLYLSENQFDLEGFKENFKETRILEQLKSIARETLNIENIDEHEMLKTALLRAYQAGSSS